VPPIRFRDVDDNSVWALYINLGVYMGSQVAPQTQGLIDVLADRRARVGEFLIDVLDAIDFEADRVQAGLF